MAWWRMALLEREFVGASNRPMTYVARVVVALGAGVIAVIVLADAPPPGQQASTGSAILNVLGSCLLALFGMAIPVQGVSAITGERERGTLALVLLSGIRPLRLILQLWLGQGLTWVSVVLTTAPVFALAYLEGGIATDAWIGWMVLLTLAVFLLSALSLAVGASCRSTVAGVVRAYALLLFGLIAGPIAVNILAALTHLPFLLLAWGGCILAVPVLLGSAASALRRGAADGMGKREFRTYDGARTLKDRWVYKRGWLSARHLPEGEPVRWREEQRATSRTRQRHRLALHGVGVLCTLFALTPGAPVVYNALALQVLLVLVHAGCTWAATERETQGWPMLVLSPLRARGVLMQKRRALAPLVRTAQVWMLLCAIVSRIGWSWWDGGATGGWGPATGMQATILSVCACVGAVVLPNAALWLGMGLGTMARTSTHALLWTAVGVGVMLIAPSLVIHLAHPASRLAQEVVLLVFPSELLLRLQFDSIHAITTLGYIGIAAGMLVWVSYLLVLRAACLHPRWLTRAEAID